MSTINLQVYEPDGTPVPPTVSRDWIVRQTLAAFERGNHYVGPDALDIHLADIVDQAACSLLRDQWKDDFPVAAYGALLQTIAALRAVLGYAPSPTAVDVNDWARSIRDASKEAVAGQPADIHEVQITEGPHRGVVLALWGPKTATPASLAGPQLTLELPIVRGSSDNLEFGTAYYVRAKRPPHPESPQLWRYTLDRVREAPAEGMRPHIPVPGTEESQK
ncbi:hypothetical protein ACIP9H_33880 [Streptomyces sp. NPDC088732]|uniref:hypothetical protein n=1 Tax=Streptomyces sp. NPDC088732 TaxID=3365879 RepID=UPI003826FF2F